MPSEVRWIHSNGSRIFYCNPEIGQVAALRPLHEVAHRIRNTSRNLHRNLQKNARTFLSYFTGGQKEARQNLTKRYVFLQILQINQLRESWRPMQRSPVRWKRGHLRTNQPTNKESLTGQTHKIISLTKTNPTTYCHTPQIKTKSLLLTTPWPIISPSSHQPNPNLETQLPIKLTLLVLTPKHHHSCSHMEKYSCQLRLAVWIQSQCNAMFCWNLLTP